jgi:Cu(I)/Ag(I) efflux system protein CusF
MRKRLMAVFAMTCFLVVTALAQQPAKPAPAQKGKSHTLAGKVEQVGSDRLTVNHGKVEGYMDAMTMPYKVDKPDILKKVKVGDQISATVYDGDYTLYDIQIVPKQEKSK